MARGSKYRARRTEYSGVVYDSKLEADFAMLLDTCRSAERDQDRVVWVARQVPWYLPGGRYLLDFMVCKADGSYCLVEVKGRKTPLGEFKRRTLEWWLGEQIAVWTKDGWQ